MECGNGRFCHDVCGLLPWEHDSLDHGCLAFHMNLPRKLKNHLAPSTNILDEAGIPWRLEHGGSHYKLMYEVGGKKHTMIVSKSPSDSRSSINLKCQVKATVREAKAWIKESGAA